MATTGSDVITFCGRAVSEKELALIRQMIAEYPNLSLTELAFTICELLEWRHLVVEQASSGLLA